jgi:hypothetical protein
MKNDGVVKINYIFGDDEQLNKRLSILLNEAVHVFRLHPDGNWKTLYKPKYAAQLANEISEKPGLIRHLLKLQDPVISNITYAAIEIYQARIKDKK